jgi:transposase-like protein
MPDEGCACVFSYTNRPIDISRVLNQNAYLVHDITLPKIRNNPNVQCMDGACPSHERGTSSITYMKYDFDAMKYLYRCDDCGTSWTNETKG